MLSLPKSSLINTKISQFFQIVKSKKCDNILMYFNANATFNSTKIVDYLWPNRNLYDIFKDLQNYKYEDYLQCYHNLLPIFQYSEIILKEFHERSSSGLQLHWMGNNVKVYMDMKQTYNNNITDTFEHVLILTSMLANALTNVYLTQTQGKNVPHLLKDLINSTEIIEVFGLELVLILKILMGSPNSINLRNIVWHGFPKPFEIPSYYINVLLITIHSLGCIIETKSLKVKERTQITTFSEHMKLVTKDYEIKAVDINHIEEKLINLNSDYKEYLLQLLYYYKNQKYKEFIILALTQIELLLRLHYGQVNNFDISAKLDEYYITMDKIFENDVPNSKGIFQNSNKLLDFDKSLFEGCIHLLYDVFVAPNGCRLRDKVSHGEVYLEALNNSQLCSLILNILVFLLFPMDFKLFDNYESKLHLNSVTKIKLNKSYGQLNKFKEKHFLNNENLPLKMFTLCKRKVLIFKRCKKESELMLLINKIAENVCKTVDNYEESIAIRKMLLSQRELHSKRRKTLEKLLSVLPDIFKTLSIILIAVSKIYYLLQNDYSKIFDDESIFDKSLRFLKHCLCISENFAKYAHYESNEWIKSLELCRKYDEFHKKLFLYEN